MADPVITNVDIGGVGFGDAGFRPETLNLSGAQTVALGTILARDSVSGKLVLYVPGGQATKSTANGPFNLITADAMVINTDAFGNETSTFTSTAATVEDTSVYTGGTAATIEDTTTYAVTDQVGLTCVVTVIDAIYGTTITTVTFVGATTTAALVAHGINDQVPRISASGASGQVIITTEAVGLDVSISVAAGTGNLTWDTPVAGTAGLANQEGLTSIVTITGGEYDGVAQTVTFTAASGFVTYLSQIVNQMNDQVDGASFAASGGQVLSTTDAQGSGIAIAIAAGTGGLTWDTPVAGTGNVADINQVTATEVKTIVEAATTALTVTVSGAAAVFTASTSISFVSGTALAKLGLSVEVVTANENGIPKAVLTYELAGANGDNAIRALVSGEVRDPKLVINDGTSLTDAIRDQLRLYGIVPIDSQEIGELDNQ